MHRAQRDWLRAERETQAGAAAAIPRLLATVLFFLSGIKEAHLPSPSCRLAGSPRQSPYVVMREEAETGGGLSVSLLFW